MKVESVAEYSLLGHSELDIRTCSRWDDMANPHAFKEIL